MNNKETKQQTNKHLQNSDQSAGGYFSIDIFLSPGMSRFISSRQNPTVTIIHLIQLRALQNNTENDTGQ